MCWLLIQTPYYQWAHCPSYVSQKSHLQGRGVALGVRSRWEVVPANFTNKSRFEFVPITVNILCKWRFVFTPITASSLLQGSQWFLCCGVRGTALLLTWKETIPGHLEFTKTCAGETPKTNCLEQSLGCTLRSHSKELWVLVQLPPVVYGVVRTASIRVVSLRCLIDYSSAQGKTTGRAQHLSEGVELHQPSRSLIIYRDMNIRRNACIKNLQ